MNKTNLTRGKIRLISYTFFLILALAVGTLTGHYRAARLSRELNASSSRSLSQLSSYISSINSDLTKGIYANSQPMLSEVVNNLARDASGAKNSLSCLPVSDVQLDNTYKFLSQVAFFVASLDRTLSEGKKITDGQRSKMQSLIAISEQLSGDISSIIENVESGETSLSGESSALNLRSRQLSTLSSEISGAEQAIDDYPTLIYDGPFSDNIMTKESFLLKSSQEITAAEALERAGSFSGIDKEKLKSSGEMEGKIASYLFSDGDISIAVSKRGGYIVYLLGSSYAGEEKISVETAREKARQFLEKNGYKGMADSYYSVDDGIITLNFAYTENGVVCYPDLIKLSVSLESGKVISFDGSGYIMNHRQREFSEPKISVSQARERLSPLLEVINVRPAIIPTEYETEKQTYEFHCRDKDGKELLVYIDTQTGLEDNILILLYSDNGILTK